MCSNCYTNLLFISLIIILVFGQEQFENGTSTEPNFNQSLTTTTSIDPNFNQSLTTTTSTQPNFNQSLTTTTVIANITLTTPAEQQIRLQACCGSNCTTFDNLMSMVGVQCCGDTPINTFDKICCANTKSYHRRSGSKYYDRCCYDTPYSDEQTCCKGKIHEGSGQSCCGDRSYYTYDRSLICCGEKLHRVPETTHSAACCGETVYDAWGQTQFCCGGQVFRRTAHHGCCVKHGTNDSTLPSEAEGYRPDQQLCCGQVYNLTEYDTCCYISDTKQKEWTPPKPVPYNSASHCCDLDGVQTFNAETGVCGA